MRKVLGLLLLLSVVSAAWAQERQDTIVVSRDGTGNFRTLQEAIESARAFMDYTVTIYVKNGVYKEKVIVPSWVENIDIIGEDRDKTIITYDDHANINKMGTFRTYTVKVEGSDITALYLHRISAESTHFIYIRMIIISNNRLITIFTYNIYIFHP